MERKIVKYLELWKNSKYRKPLIINGARQVGKTYISLLFGKNNYKNCVYFNFERSVELLELFNKSLDTNRILDGLSMLSGETISKHDTLIIFDEIQACSRALTSLKYFCEENNDYHIIAAGSLLGVAINRGEYSFPVGKVDMTTLYPLDFEEFLWAIDKRKIAEGIRENFKKNEEFFMHDIAIDFFNTYLLIGGMPRVLKEYIETKDFNIASSLQKDICDAYIADMAKYSTPNDTIKIMRAYESVPTQLAKENKKFQYKIIKTGARAAEYEVPLHWLKASGLINICTKVSEGKLPLVAYSDTPSFKVYMGDTGLLCYKSNIFPNYIFSKDERFNGFKGSLIENYVCSALVSNGFSPFYREDNGKNELDFVIQDEEGNVVPIEVKSSTNVKARSLMTFMKKYDSKYGIRISMKNFGYENGIKSVPLYATFCIDKSI